MEVYKDTYFVQFDDFDTARETLLADLVGEELFGVALIAIDKQEIERDQITDLVRRRLKANPELAVLINPDEHVEHGLVVDMMDQAREGGTIKMAIAVKPKDRRR